MDKAVLCIAHKAPEQINILIGQLLNDAKGRTDIYIHLDKKSESIREQIMENPHVFFIKNSHSVNWGNDSNVRMLVDCFSEIESYGKSYDYFQICTGQDLMVRCGLDEFLERNNGQIFIEITKNDNYIKNLLCHRYPKWLQKDVSGTALSTLCLIYDFLTRTVLIPKKKIEYDINSLDLYVSYNWCFMPYEVLLYINQFLKENPGFLTIYWDTRVPEDGFLGTLIRNSPYREQVVFKQDGKMGESLTYHNKLEGCHFTNVSMNDLEAIEKSGCFLARKFDIKTNPDIVNYFAEKVNAKNKN